MRDCRTSGVYHMVLMPCHPFVLLDIANSYPSTPKPLLWETMYTLGIPPAMISTLRHGYQHTQCCFSAQVHTYRQQRGVKEGYPLSPLLLSAVYECFHCTLSRQFPSVNFFVYMGDIAFISPDAETT